MNYYLCRNKVKGMEIIMRQAIIQFFRLLISAVAVLFCLSVLFGKIGGIDIKSMGKRLAEQAESRSVFSENGTRLMQLLELPAPQVEVEHTLYLTGETYHFLSHIRVRQSAEEEWEYAAKTEDFSVEILDVTEEAGEKAGGDWGKGELFFSQAGRYVVKLRVTGPYGRTVIQRILIPVVEV